MKQVLLLVLVSTCLIVGKCKKSEEKPEWAKKDIRDFSDADMERLLDQWDVSFSIFFHDFNACPFNYFVVFF
jgi:hypothetical protein